MTVLRLLALTFSLLSAIVLISPEQAASGNTKDAMMKFPDQTAEGLAQRDAYIRKCQRDSRVPVRQGLAPKE